MDEHPGPERTTHPTRHPTHRRRGRSIATVLTIVGLTASAAACGQGKDGGARISLVPNPAASGRSWDWTSACRVGPRSTTGCAASAPRLGVAQLAGNEWNLGGSPSAGSVRMSVNASGAVEVKGSLSSAPPCTDSACIAPQANTWVRGFPSVLYGVDQCHAATSPRPSPDLQLPVRVRSLPSDLIGSATYDAQAAQVTYDVAYDLWLNASGTPTPCQTDGTVEVMVWTDYDAQSLLPDGSKIGTATVPYSVNGRVDPGNQAWSLYANNVYGDGHTAPWGGTIWLVLDAAHIAQEGTVTVDLSTALDAAGTLLQNTYGWNDFANNYWLDTIAFGTEFGPQNADPYGAGPIDFSLDLSSYCLDVGTTVSAAACSKAAASG